MDKDAVWGTILQERTALADVLDTLSPEEWEHPSLCTGWSVRDVAAHLVSAPEVTVAQLATAVLRSRGNVNRMIHDEARRASGRPTAEIVADFRRLATSRRLPPGTSYHDRLLDTLVHFQDITIPLGRHHDMPLDAARESADHASGRRASFFRVNKKLAGFRLEATDTDWASGHGAAVRGPIAALLLLLTGRPAALQSLEGEGIAQVRQRLETAS